jgi:hypothetical protein
MKKAGSLVSSITNIHIPHIQATLQSPCLKKGIRTVTVSETCVSKLQFAKVICLKNDFWIILFSSYHAKRSSLFLEMSQISFNFFHLIYMYDLQADSASILVRAHLTLGLKGGLVSGFC